MILSLSALLTAIRRKKKKANTWRLHIHTHILLHRWLFVIVMRINSRDESGMKNEAMSELKELGNYVSFVNGSNLT
jgi:hypothetical protein